MAHSKSQGATLGLQQDLDQLLDFDAASALESEFGLVSASQAQSTVGAFDHGQLDAITTDMLPSPNPNDEDYADFPKYIPNFVKPDRPCDYCASRGLDCHMYFGKVTCKACDSLFRPCSFAHVSESGTIGQRPKSGAIDTLHIVSEDACVEQGTMTGIKMMRSNGAPAGVLFDESKKTNNRFPRAAVKVLRTWFEAHATHPYPTEDEKMTLEQQTELKASQIATWLANTRRRSKTTGTKRAQSPSVTTRTQPVDMSTASQARSWSDLTPYERWQHSPPENDPAPIHAIADAVAANELPQMSRRSSSNTRGTQDSSSGASYSAKRALSITSTGRESAQSNSRSAGSSIVWSQGSQSSFGSFNSFGSGAFGKRDRQRKRKIRASAMKKTDDGKRIFQCTFCCDMFKTKYDWTRHEKTLHLSLEKWICTPFGPTTADPDTGILTCAYCKQENPTKEHTDSHGHDECESKGLEARTFYRKDHLRQHLRLMHHCELIPSMTNWMVSADEIACRCGFCAERFTSWDARNAHIAAHYKAGAKMSQWKSCRGLDPEVAAMVTNAMPPYLIGFEQGTPNPFSASRGNTEHSQCSVLANASGNCEGFPMEDTIRQLASRPSTKATCWEILTINLGKYVQEQADLGIPVTDQMLQSQARIIIYGGDDPLDHTSADNPEWLDLFKKAHGINMIPSEIGGIGQTIPEDLELYVDLGIRIPFHLQQRHAAQQDRVDTAQRVKSIIPTNATYQDAFSAEARSHRDATGWTAYDYMPIPAERAAHFVNAPAKNPLVPASTSSSVSLPALTGTMTTGTSVNSPRSAHSTAVAGPPRFSPTLSTEQQAAWDRDVAREVENMILGTEGQGQGQGQVHPADLAMLDFALGDGGVEGPMKGVQQKAMGPAAQHRMEVDPMSADGFDPMEFLNADMMLDDAPMDLGAEEVEFDFGEVSFT